MKETKVNAFEQMTFDVNYPQFAKEACENCYGGLYAITWNILNGLIAQVAQRATELGDPVLDALMIKLNLYDIPNEDRRKTIEKLHKIYLSKIKETKQ